MKKIRRGLVFGIFMVLFHGSRAQKVFYVSLSGHGSNAGTIHKPFHSLSQAVSAVLLLKDKNVKIQLRGGTYYLDTALVIKANALQCASLKIENYPGEKVIISAGRKLLLKWQPFKNRVYKTTVPTGVIFERLYVNDQLQQMARYPNYDSAKRIYHGTASDAISPERVKKWKDPTGGYVHALHTGEWGSWDYMINGKKKNGELELQGGWQNNRPSEMHPEYRFVENVLEELDAPGEWFLDRKNRILYYYPDSNIDLGTSIIEVSHLKNSIALKGTADHTVANVEIKGLHFVHNERSFMETKEPLLRSDWSIYRSGAILFDGTTNCKVTNCSFTGLGGNAIMFSNYNSKDSVTGCYVANIGASAVCLVGNPAAVRSPLFNYTQSLSYNEIDKTPGPRTNDYPQECVVSNNLFRNLGEIEKQATGVEIAMSSSIIVSHNTIYNTPRAGINIGDGCWGGHVISYNDVFNTVMETGDHGAFNSWGRDRYWNPDWRYMDSITRVHPELILLDAQKRTVICNNRFRCDHGWDIDLDDGSSNYHIYNNVCLNGGLKLREGFYRTVENNIMVNNSFHPHVWFVNSGDVFRHNIVTTAYAPIAIRNWGKNIDHNFFLSAEGLKEAKATGTDQNSIAGDAMFIDAALGIYTVAPMSPTLGVGFKNFPMTQCGVQDTSLKKIALQPFISRLLTDQTPGTQSAVITFFGGLVRSVNGPGERSAFGLPDESGVIILSVGENRSLSKSGLQVSDVIRTAAGRKISGTKDLLNMIEASMPIPSVPIEFIRNQQLFKIELYIGNE